MDAVRPVIVRSWLITKADEFTDGVVEVATTGVAVLYQTTLDAGTFVVQVIWVEVAATLVAATPEIATDGGKVVKLNWLEYAVLFEASADPTT